MGNRNNFTGDASQQLANLLIDLQRRIERLELADGLVDVHPVTGSDDFLGTVMTLPDGTPVLIASRDKGLELPGTSGVATRPGLGSEGYTISTLFSGVQQIVWDVSFVGVLTDAVEIEHNVLVNRIGGGLANVDVWLQPFTVNEFGNPVLTTPSTKTTFSSGFWTTGYFRWRHGLDFDASQLWGVRIMLEVSHDCEVQTDRPGLSAQRSSDVIANFDPAQPFQPW